MKADTRSKVSARQAVEKETGEWKKGVPESSGEANKSREKNANHGSGSEDGSATRGKARHGETDEHDIEEIVPLTFPQRMMEILDDEAHADVISWLPHGRGFLVKDKKRFADEIMPKYFSKKPKFTSFTRKLNRWSFTRVTRGPEVGAYYHPQFQKGNHRLCMQMTCIGSKTSQQIQPLNPIALGIGGTELVHTGFPGAPVDPITMGQLQAQQKFFQQQSLMSMATASKQQAKEHGSADDQSAGNKEKKEAATASGGNNTQRAQNPDLQHANNSAAALQQQQHQYCEMLMAYQQQQMAAMARDSSLQQQAAAMNQNVGVQAPSMNERGIGHSPEARSSKRESTKDDVDVEIV